jgi:hypothetical protein
MPIRSSALYASLILLQCASGTTHASEPIQVGFLWHMHQPRYVPDLDPFGADSFFSFSVPDIHNQRLGPYTNWPKNAVDAGSFLPHLGAHVSFSGSLIENLNALESSGINGGIWNNWDWAYSSEQLPSPTNNYTTLGNPRLEMIGFGYFHPLMPLIDDKSIHLQIALHQRVRSLQFGTPMDSAGLFPPETAFSTRMIPALVETGLDWVLVDNFHFDRACVNYPHTDATGVARPNRADQINPDPASLGGRWVQLQNLWAPSQVSVPFGYQPHYAQHIDPETGMVSRIVAVPAARYEGNEDGRGGYGAFLYDQVMDAYLQDNTDPNHPMFVVLHHDGDNFGGGSEGYYNHNFQNMVNWVSNDPDYEVSTVDDYLERFPVDPSDVIHIEDGSWAGADAGDPEFKKWLGGDVSAGAISPDFNSWAALTAARNALEMIDVLAPIDPTSTSDLNHIINATGSVQHRAWRMMLVGQASDYWYWDGTEVWDSNPTRAANEVVAIASSVLGGSPSDIVAPTIFVPQREPYNPGAIEFGSQAQPSDFEVWTLVDDYTGIQTVTLKWRIDLDGINPLDSIQNETFAGGPEVGLWNSIHMTSNPVPTPAGVLSATRKAERYGAMIVDQEQVLIDYYVEAIDIHGNVSKSDILHVWVGDGTGGNGGGSTAVAVSPDPVIAGEDVTIAYTPGNGPLANASSIWIHYGFNGWSTVLPDVQMDDSDNDGVYEITVPVPSSATQLNCVFNDGGSIWDNNNGNDWAFTIEGGGGDPGFVIDGNLDAGATLLGMNNGISLWAALDDDTLYLACTPAGNGLDRFLVLASEPESMQGAMWGKAGQVTRWDAFVGNEGDNGWAGWFDQTGITQLASGSVLEATIDLASEYGAVPDTVHLAALSFGTSDGSTLDMTRQVPATQDGDGNVELNEFYALNLCTLRDGGCCPADLTGDGTLNFFDVSAFLSAYASADLGADFNNDGSLNFFDVSAFLSLFNAGCP